MLTLSTILNLLFSSLVAVAVMMADFFMSIVAWNEIISRNWFLLLTVYALIVVNILAVQFFKASWRSSPKHV